MLQERRVPFKDWTPLFWVSFIVFTVSVIDAVVLLGVGISFETGKLATTTNDYSTLVTALDVLRNCSIGAAVTMLITLAPALISLFLPATSAIQGMLACNIALTCIGVFVVLIQSIIPLFFIAIVETVCDAYKNSCYICPDSQDDATCLSNAESNPADNGCYYRESDYNLLCGAFREKLRAAVALLFIGTALLITSCILAIILLVTVKKKNAQNQPAQTQTVVTITNGVPVQGIPMQQMPPQGYSPQPGYDQQPAYGQQPGYAQPQPGYAQPPQQPAYAQPPQYA